MDKLLKVSSNPHIRSKETTSNIMLYVVLALLPATGFGVYNFGLHALLLVLVTVASTVLTEYIYEKCMKKKITIGDLSAVVTGLLLALNLPQAVLNLPFQQFWQSLLCTMPWAYVGKPEYRQNY